MPFTEMILLVQKNIVAFFSLNILLSQHNIMLKACFVGK